MTDEKEEHAFGIAVGRDANATATDSVAIGRDTHVAGLPINILSSKDRPKGEMILDESAEPVMLPRGWTLDKLPPQYIAAKAKEKVHLRPLPQKGDYISYGETRRSFEIDNYRDEEDEPSKWPAILGMALVIGGGVALLLAFLAKVSG